MNNLIPDGEFESSLAWEILGTGVSISSGKLRFLFATTNRVAPLPLVPSVIGTEYVAKVSIASVSNGLSARLLWGGEEVWTKSEGAGEFEKRIVATASGGLVFQSFGDTFTVERVSVEEIVIKYSEIRNGIRQILLAVSDPNMPLPANIAWENREYKPVDGTPWIRETLLPGSERQSASDTLESVGIMQYDLFWPAGDGTEDVEDLADTIKSAFKPVTGIGTHSLIFRAERLAAIQDDKWLQLPIRLTWRAHAIG